jgi:hypothetical protein
VAHLADAKKFDLRVLHGDGTNVPFRSARLTSLRGPLGTMRRGATRTRPPCILACRPEKHLISIFSFGYRPYNHLGTVL